MRCKPYNDLMYMHHKARWIQSLELWTIVNQDKEIVATISTSATKNRTVLAITLILGEHEMTLSPITRPSGMRTAIRWVCQELNNGNLWLSTRLFLEREARLLDYDEPQLLACWHAGDYRYCLRLLGNLPGLLDWELARG